MTAPFLLIGLLWKIAPGKTLSVLFSMTGEASQASRAEPAAGLHAGSLSAAQCAPCHAEHFEEWSRSFHARSLTSEGFLRTFPQYLDFLGSDAQEDPGASMACFNCHAPLLQNAEPAVIRRVTGWVLARETKRLDGFEVGCVACHGDGSRIFSGPIRDPQDNPFHLSKFSTSYKEASLCAGCHAWAPSTVPCSDVYTDWTKSRAAKEGRTCQSCHMPERSGVAAAGGPPRKIHSHVFPGANSPAMLREAVVLDLEAGFREDRLEVAATVRNLAPHRVPDG